MVPPTPAEILRTETVDIRRYTLFKRIRTNTQKKLKLLLNHFRWY